jgi:hypothetical protein
MMVGLIINTIERRLSELIGPEEVQLIKLFR